MLHLISRLRALAVCLVLTLAFVGLAAPGAFAASFMDPGLKDVPVDQRVTVATPQPVQIIFQFQTDGAVNDRATKALKKQVIDTVIASGLFSEVSEAPVANGAVLSVTINNVAADSIKDATAQGFVTGLTFGLKGSLVTDRYVCTVQFVAGPDAPKISRQVNHAIHTTIGLKSVPPELIKTKNLMDAVMTMTRQVVSNGLNQVAADPDFGGIVPPALQAAMTPPPATPAAPAEAAAPAETPTAPATPAPEAPAAAPSR